MKPSVRQLFRTIFAAGMAAGFGLSLPELPAQGIPDSSLYMHNIKGQGEPVDLGQLLDAATQKLVEQDSAAVSDGRVKGTVVTISGNQSVMFPRRIVSNDVINQNNGRTIRFYVWICGEEIEASGNLWLGAPAVRIFLNDANGNHLAGAESLFKTRGTYPWHCYYIDFAVPKNAQLPANDSAVEQEASAAGQVAAVAEDGIDDDFDALFSELGLDDGNAAAQRPVTASGLYLELSCRGGGRAHFGGLNYEVLPAGYSDRRDSMRDAASGTYAPNPQYDELPMMLMYGLDADAPWKFMDGNNAFESLKSRDGLDSYLDKNHGDWLQMQYGIAKLPYIYVTGRALKLADGFESGWLDHLNEKLNAYQDDKTGLWVCGGSPNIAVSAAIVNGCYSPASRKRSDVKSEATPWNAAGDHAKLHFADRIIATLLKCRIDGTAAWNRFCLQEGEFSGNADRRTPDLATTTAAMQLLARAAEQFSPADRQYGEAQNAIRDAWYYCAENFVMPSKNGLWREKADDLMPSRSGAFFFDLIESTRLLEQRVNPSLQAPAITATRIVGDREQLAIEWDGKGAGIVAIRIYCAGGQANKELLTDKNLIGIIEKQAGTFSAGDPYVTIRTIAESARRHWGITPAVMGASYLEEKLNAISRKIAIGVAGKKLTVQPPSELLYQEEDDGGSEDTLKFYLAGVNSYGEITAFTEIATEKTE